MNQFELCVGLTKTHEKGFQNHREDKGNWTGGAVGKGVLKGTKYGISAAMYPYLDIPNLTWEKAKELYREDYWKPSQAEDLVWPFNFLLFDAYVNHSPKAAVVMLQQTANVVPDGVIGPKTKAAVNSLHLTEGVVEFSRHRMNYMLRLPGETFDVGWSNRIFDNQRIALGLEKHS